jgi:signal transduction histidine kinase/sensor domain CHASE-containing protein
MPPAASSDLSPVIPPPPPQVLPARVWLIAAAVFLLSLLLCGLLFEAEAQARKREHRQAVADLAHLNAREIGDRLDRALSASFALAAVLRQGEGRIDNFPQLAGEMIRSYGGIGALQLAPGGVVRQVMPLAGNERAIGFNPLQDPVQGFEARRAVELRRLVLTGPFELVQGGYGVVGRYPVFLGDAPESQRFWGLIQVVIRVNELLAVTSIGQLRAAGHEYLLWRIDPASGERVVFARSGEAPLHDPVDVPIAVPEGRWTLSVEAAARTGSPFLRFGNWLVALLVSGLLAGAAVLLLRKPFLLQHELARRAATEASLQLAAERLRQIINTMDSGIVLWSSEQRLVAWNEAFAHMFPGVAHALRVGVERQTLVAMMRAAGEFAADAQDVSGNWEALGAWDRNLPGGRIVAIRRLATADGGRLVLHEDVTAARRASDVLMRNERMASLGRLVAGIAHEINTPIGNALMVASSVQQRVDEMEETIAAGQLRRSSFESFLGMVRESDGIIVRNLTRAAELIQHFKGVAVDQTSDRRRPFDLAEVLDEVVATLMPRIRRSTHVLQVELTPGIAMDGYPGALGQIVTNLIENSLLHAFPLRSGGAMRLSARPLDAERVELLFSDDGAGIPAADRARIFDPFFTTRMGQGGSGLGLSIVLNLTRDLLGGELDFSSELGQGCRFRFVLPRVAPRKECPSSLT